MELQQSLFRYSPDLDSTSEKNVGVPLNLGAKKCLVCETIFIKKKYNQEFCSRKCWNNKNIEKIKNYSYTKGKRCLNCNIHIPNKNVGLRCRSCNNKFFALHHHKHFIRKQLERTKNIVISKKAEQIILGSLLGDASLNNSKRKIVNSIFCRYIEKHSLKQEEYLIWKSEILNLPNSIKKYTIHNNGSKRTDGEVIIYVTPSIPQLLYYHNLFYPSGKKIVTREILDKLEPLGLAVWYMDDGYYESGDIYTNSFSYEEHLVMQKWFKEKFNLDIKIRNTSKRGKYLPNNYIHLNSSNFKKFIDIIKPHIPECMIYKLSINPKRIIHKQKYNKKYKLNKKISKSFELIFNNGG